MSHIRVSQAVVFSALALALILPASAAAGTHVAIGVGFGGPFYPYYWGGPWGYGPWGYPYYGPYGPYPYAPYGYGYGYDRPTGEVHIKSPDPNAMIYIDGSYEGRAHNLKTLHLPPGTYDVEQRIGPDVQRQRLYVVADRSARLEFAKPGTHANSNAAPPPPPDTNQQPAPPPSPESNSAPAPAPQPQRQ